MLQTIRDRAHGILAWIILISIAVPFALWGIQNYLDVGKEKPVATVGDKELFERDVNRIAEQDLSSLVGLDEQDEKAIRRQALERLVHETLLREEVQRLHMGLGEEGLREIIMALPYFQTDGKFDKDKYKLSVSSQGMSSNAFAAQIRMAVAMDQYRHAIAGTAFATPREVDQFLRLKHQRRSVEYVLLPVAKEGEAPTSQAVADYYHAHENEFLTPEQVAVQYVELNQEQVARQIQVSEEDLKAYYEEQKASYITPERRRLSHILLGVDPSAKDDAYAAALAKAKQAAERLAKGEDFAAVAKAVSEDRLSAAKGGDLGVIGRGQMDKNFEDAAFQLSKAGQVSEPVKTTFGYHLIKLTEFTPGKTKTFEEAKEELRSSYQHNAAEKRFYELGEKLSQLGFEHPDSLEPVAEAIGAKVQETALFSRDAGAGVAANPALRTAAFSQDVLENRNSEAVELAPGQVVLLHLKEHVAAKVRPLEEVRGAIEAKLRHEAAETAAKARAKALFDRVQQGVALEEAAKAEHLTVEKPQPFGRDETGKVPMELVLAAFHIAKPAEGQTAQQLVSLSNGGQALLRLLSVADGDAATVDAKEKSAVRDLLARSKGQAQYASALEQLRADGDVSIPDDAKK